MELIGRVIKQKTSAFKGKEDIYAITPDRKRPRSSWELEDNCQENLENDLSLNIFLKDSTISDTSYLNKKTEETYQIEVEAGTYSIEITIPRSHRETKSLPQFPEWKKAMDSEINTMLPVARRDFKNRGSSKPKYFFFFLNGY